MPRGCAAYTVEAMAAHLLGIYIVRWRFVSVDTDNIKTQNDLSRCVDIRCELEVIEQKKRNIK